MYKTMCLYTSPYTSIQHLTPLFITVHLYTMVMCIHEFYCTEKYSRKTDEYVCSRTYVFVLREWYFFTGAVICLLRIADIFPYWSLYFCTEINISVLGYILLDWCIFYCTGKYTRTANEYVCILRYRIQWYNIYLCLAVVGQRRMQSMVMYRGVRWCIEVYGDV